MLAVIAGGPWLSRRRVPHAPRPQDEAPLGHHDLSRSEPGEHRVAVAHRLAPADLALDQLALLVPDPPVDDPALAHRPPGPALEAHLAPRWTVRRLITPALGPGATTVETPWLGLGSACTGACAGPCGSSRCRPDASSVAWPSWTAGGSASSWRLAPPIAASCAVRS